jgi:CDP-6-deoxy-D-xylo-4-hexulose-3-dehydrase
MILNTNIMIQESKKQLILKLVSELILEKRQTATWIPGKDWIKYSGPYYDDKEYVAAVSSLLDEWLVMGEKGILFEKKFSKLLGKEHGILTNSGSSANLLMMSALKSKRLFALPDKTKVITPVAGFPTTINPILQNNFVPVFIDIELETLNLDLEQLEEAAKKGARILTFAHVLGNPPNMDRVMEIVERYELIFLEDCCDALGSYYKGKKLGSYGDMSSCSFYPAHHITMGEGGFVSTQTKQQEIIVRSFRDWGRGCYCVGQKANLLKNGTCKKRFSCWLPAAPEQIFDHKYVYEEIGYNLKPTELQAAMGLEQIKKLNIIDLQRRENYRRLFNIFKPYEEFFILPIATEGADPSWFAFPLTIKDSSIFNRSEITNFFEDCKIQTRNYFAGNILLHPAYQHLSDLGRTIKDFPNATKVTTDTFFLGTSPVVTSEQMEYIEEKTRKFMSNY